MASGDTFNPYRVLGLERGATAAQVARAYRSAAKQSHPDLHGPDAEHRMQQLNRAFQLLSDPDLRAAWDAAHPVAGLPIAHWEHRSRGAGVPAPGAAPASWAGLEVDRGAYAAGTVRVRAAGVWPRGARQPAPSTTGLRDSAWLAVAVAAVLLVALLFLGWVASTPRYPASARQAIDGLGLTASSLLPLSPDRELAVVRDPSGTLMLVAAERVADRGWEARILAQVGATHPISVTLYRDVDAPGGAFPSVAFGRADGEAAQVRLLGVESRGGDVTNGTWAVALPAQIDAEDLVWEFVRADGSVIVHGSGELNPP